MKCPYCNEYDVDEIPELDYDRTRMSCKDYVIWLDAKSIDYVKEKEESLKRKYTRLQRNRDEIKRRKNNGLHGRCVQRYE